MFYAASTRGFYDPEIHGDNIPADAVRLTREQHQALLVAQSKGKIIVPAEDGRPTLADRPVVEVARTCSPLEFIERFTEAEQLAVVTAAMQVPALRLWYDKLMAAQQVVEDDPRLAIGLDALVSAGLITEQRRNEVMQWS